MRNLQRILPYLILNIIVSAVTTLGVLWAWDYFRLGRAGSETPAVQEPAGEVEAAADVTPLPVDEELVRIEGVFGSGDLANEYIRFVRTGEGDLSLRGWRLRDQDGNEYTFPEINFITGAIELYTNSGRDSVIELHWGLNKAVWQKGEKAELVDPQGNLRAEYQVP